MGTDLPSGRQQQPLAWATLLLFATVLLVLASAQGALVQNCRADNFFGTYSGCVNQGICSSGGCECSHGSDFKGQILSFCEKGYVGCSLIKFTVGGGCTLASCGPYSDVPFWINSSETGYVTVYKGMNCTGEPAMVNFMVLRASSGESCVYTGHNGLMPATNASDCLASFCASPMDTAPSPPPNPLPPLPSPPEPKHCRADNFFGTYSGCVSQGICSLGGCECSHGSDFKGEILAFCDEGYVGCSLIKFTVGGGCTSASCGPYSDIPFWINSSETGYVTVYKGMNCTGEPAMVNFMVLRASSGERCVYPGNNGLMPATNASDCLASFCASPTDTAPSPPPNPLPPLPSPPEPKHCRADNFFGTYSGCVNQGICSSGGCECSHGSDFKGQILSFCEKGYVGCSQIKFTVGGGCTFASCGPYSDMPFWINSSETGYVTVYKGMNCTGEPAMVNFMVLRASSGERCVYPGNNGLMPATNASDCLASFCASFTDPAPSPPNPLPPPPSPPEPKPCPADNFFGTYSGCVSQGICSSGGCECSHGSDFKGEILTFCDEGYVGCSLIKFTVGGGCTFASCGPYSDVPFWINSSETGYVTVYKGMNCTGEPAMVNFMVLRASSGESCVYTGNDGLMPATNASDCLASFCSSPTE